MVCVHLHTRSFSVLHSASLPAWEKREREKRGIIKIITAPSLFLLLLLLPSLKGNLSCSACLGSSLFHGWFFVCWGENACKCNCCSLCMSSVRHGKWIFFGLVGLSPMFEGLYSEKVFWNRSDLYFEILFSRRSRKWVGEVSSLLFLKGASQCMSSFRWYRGS